MALYIALTFPNPPQVTNIPNRVLFTNESHSCYTIKAGYKMIRNKRHRPSHISTHLWQAIWRQKNILPRIQFFLWRIVQNGLPIGETWARKLNLTVPACALCGNDTDSVMHIFFYCHFAKAVWLASPLGLLS
jgi:zinc-binding in reverse transcriptase